MKRMVVILAILALITIAGIMGIFYLRDLHLRISELADEAVGKALRGDREGAGEIVGEIRELWKSKMKILKLYVRRSNLDEVLRMIDSLKPLLEQDQIPDFAVHIERIKGSVTLVYENEIPSLHTIF